MSSQFTLDNEGVGASGLLTMAVDASSGKDFTQDDLDDNLTACVVSDNNEVGTGASGDKLFGKVIAVSEEEQPDTAIPAYCTVQARGVARFKYNPAAAPQVNEMVEVDGAGKVKQSSADPDIAAGGHMMRGQVIAVDSGNQTCDVWLG